MLPIVEIDRKEATIEGTLGVVSVNKRLFCVCLEPYTDKRIPAGMYTAHRFLSPRFKRHTFKFQHVLDRSNIEFHPGNVVEDTKGCVLLGKYPGKLRVRNKNERAVLNSGKTFVAFMDLLNGYDEIIVIIRDNY